MQFEGRVAWVAGVEAPCGAAIARALAKAGARVRLAGAEAAGAEALAAEIGAEALPPGAAPPEPPAIHVEAAALPSLPARITETGGLLMALSAAERPALRLAEAAGRLGSGGVALLVSPVAAGTAGDWAELHLGWRSEVVARLGRELAPSGVRVLGLAPVVGGTAKLPGFLSKGAPPSPLGRAATPQEVASAALWLLGQALLTGVTLPLDGGRGL